MSLDLNKVDVYKSFRLYVRNAEDEEDDMPETLEQALLNAQKDTDKSGFAVGVYKLIKYTEAAAPRATVLDVPT